MYSVAQLEEMLNHLKTNKCAIPTHERVVKNLLMWCGELKKPEPFSDIHVVLLSMINILLIKKENKNYFDINGTSELTEWILQFSEEIDSNPDVI